jgi:hypothetical protein
MVWRKKQQTETRQREICGDCGVDEGHYHVLGCDKEDCPFCGRQLISCYCCYELLNLIDEDKYDESTSNLPPEIYEKGLTEEQEKQWEASNGLSSFWFLMKNGITTFSRTNEARSFVESVTISSRRR